jgi:hypothetical protein
MKGVNVSWLLVGGGVILFLLLFTLLSGWRELAKHYRARRRLRGPSFWFRSGTIGLVAYGSCLFITADPEGLGLRNMFPFRLWEGELLLPWSEVSVETRPGLFSRVIFTPERTPGVTLTFSARLARKVVKAAGISLESLPLREHGGPNREVSDVGPR